MFCVSIVRSRHNNIYCSREQFIPPVACTVESTDLSTGKHHLVLAPWTPIAKPEEVVSDTLEGVLHYRIDDDDGDG